MRPDSSDPPWIGALALESRSLIAPAVNALASVFAHLEAGDVPVTTRALTQHEHGSVVVGPAIWPARGAACVKVTTLTPGNAARDIPLIHGTALLIDLATGRTRAALDGAALTSLRTGAVVALATLALASPDADELGLVGAGVQARSITRAIDTVRPLRTVRLASRSHGRAQEFQNWAAATMPSARVEIVETIADAVRDAPIVVTATSTDSTAPLVRAEWIMPGAHVNVVGGTHPGAIELDPDALRGAVVVVEHASAVAEGVGELTAARAAGIAEAARPRGLGTVLTFPRTGRATTIFRSVGLPAADVAVAVAVYDSLVAST